MDGRQHKRIAKVLIIVSIVTYLLLYILKGIFRFGIVPFPGFLLPYRDICPAASLILLVFILTPLLFFLQHHAKHAKMRIATVLSRIGIGAMAWVLIFSIIEIIKIC